MFVTRPLTIGSPFTAVAPSGSQEPPGSGGVRHPNQQFRVKHETPMDTSEPSPPWAMRALPEPWWGPAPGPGSSLETSSRWENECQECRENEPYMNLARCHQGCSTRTSMGRGTRAPGSWVRSWAVVAPRALFFWGAHTHGLLSLAEEPAASLCHRSETGTVT